MAVNIKAKIYKLGLDKLCVDPFNHKYYSLLESEKILWGRG